MSYQWRATPTYNDCLKRYDNDKETKAALFDAISALSEDPFNHPSLNTHRVKRANGKTYTSYVGHQGQRLIWRLIGSNVVVLLLFGEHDAVYRRAERLQLEIDDQVERVRVYDANPTTGEAQPYTERRQLEGTLFMAWTDEELESFGFHEHEVQVLRRLDAEGELLALEERMRPESFRTAMNLYLYNHPEGAVAAERRRAEREAEEASLPEPEVDETSDVALERALQRPASRAEFAPVGADELASVLSKPIEDWMIFLHPDQVKLAERPYSGPARVRGAAGTGKTVVALHRARHLSRTYDGRILFTTYIRNLPNVLEELFRRLSPETSDRVEFNNIHSWAFRYLKSSGSRINIDPQRSGRAFNQAWDAVATDGSLLADCGLPRPYFQEEIDWVIKGRALKSLSQYLGLERSGRGTPLQQDLRTAVWGLYEEYQHQLSRSRVSDFNDLLIQAYHEVRSRGVRPYRAVIVDEAQDLTEVGVRLLNELAGSGEPDGLFMVGDGQQSIYPGGYSLGSLGIDVRGRSTILRTNYRNTAQILDAARRVVEGRPYDDNDADLTSEQQRAEVLREGAAPVYAAFEDADDHDEGLVLAISEAAERPEVNPGDIAVLVPTNRLVDHYASMVASLGYSTLKLEKYDGTPTQQVKVGTYKRAKGLEFKYVLLPRLEPETVGEVQRHNEDEQTHQERIDLLRRQLYVAMTRARDGLWCGWVGEPSALLRYRG